jgi:hypothetical protein
MASRPTITSANGGAQKIKMIEKAIRVTGQWNTRQQIAATADPE